MSDDTDKGKRDTSGRFVRRAAEKANELHTPSDDGVHPMAKILFGWTEYKNIGSLIFWALAVLSVLLIVVDVSIHRHEYFKFAESTGFYGLWGFGAFTFVVLMGWPLGHLLRRGENYYGDLSGPPADIDPAADIPEMTDALPTYEDDA